MKTKLLVPAIFLALAVASINTNHSSLQVKAITEDENFIVNVGDSINVEDRVLIHNEERKTVPGQIIFPDGSTKRGRSFIVSMPGIYQVVYSAYFGFEQEKETITYSCYRKSSDFFTSSNSNNLPSVGEYSFNNKFASVQGAVLNLNTQTTFTFVDAIDFNSFDPNTPFIEYMVDTSKQGESDLESFMIRLTDINNSSNFVDINVNDSGPIDDDGQGSYILAGAYNQFKTGYEFFGGRYVLHVNSFGCNVGSSFRALPINNPVKPTKLYFDYAEKSLYARPIMGSVNNKDLITDLDSESIYGSFIWNGFSEGKAYLSITAKSVIGTSAKLVVSRIGNMDLSQMVFEDHSAPAIEIDYNGQSPSNLPKATVNRSYDLFKANIIDNYDKDLSYSVSVAYNDLESGKKKDVSVINNAFTPKQTGTYIVTYTARDYSNNVTTKTMNVVAVNESQVMSISLDETSMTDIVYSKFNLPSVDDVHITGGSGKPQVVRRIVNSNNEEIAIKGDTFIPTEVGTYNVFYTAVDYIGNVATAKLTINALNTNEPIFIGDLVLPRVLIKGHSYSLPSYQGFETINNVSNYLTSSIYVNDQLLSDGKFVAGDTCNVSYRVTGQTGSNQYNATIPVIDGNDCVDQAAYFYGNTFEAQENEFDVSLFTNSDANAVFASVLAYDRPSVSFAKDPTLNNYQQLLFKFSQADNPNLSLTFKVRFEDDLAYVSIGNSTKEYDLGYETREGRDVYSLNFDNATCFLTDINYKNIVKINNDDLDNPFTGFTGGLYLDISLSGVTGASKINILSISNQDFGHRGFYLDTSSPIMIFDGKFVNEQYYNETAYIPTVSIFDVLGEATATLTVKAPDGSFKLRNVDPTKPQSFTLDAFGSYILTFRAEDTSGNFVSYPRKIAVFDTIPPTLTVKNNLKASYKINAQIKIPTYTVSDNLGQYTVDVLLMLPNDEERLLLRDINGEVTSYLTADSPYYNPSFKVNATTFRAEQYGTYRLRFVAYDDAFNKVVEEITFIVK